LAGIAADTLTRAQAEKQTGMAHQRVSDLSRALEDPDGYRERLLGLEYCAAFLMGDSDRAGKPLPRKPDSNEYYTPAKYIEAAREVLGVIDLDPASCAAANKTVRAATYFTKRDDGLAKEWRGNVWLNAPYGSLVGRFIDKLSEELAAARVPAAICLVNAHCTDTAWFRQLYDGHLCFTNHRINFTGDESRSGSNHGSVFVYFGPDRARFRQAFCRFGDCLVRG
jgi:hypothetical protein